MTACGLEDLQTATGCCSSTCRLLGSCRPFWFANHGRSQNRKITQWCIWDFGREARVEHRRRDADEAPYVSAELAQPPFQNFFHFLNENGVFWCTLEHCLKLMYLQQKVSHQTSMHCACRFFAKNWACDARKGPSPNDPQIRH